MSLEIKIEKLTEEIARLTAVLSASNTVVEAPKQPSQPESVAVTASTPVTPAPAVEVPPSPPAAPVTQPPSTPAPVSTPVVEAPPVAQPASMTPEELNNELVIEFQRLGGREEIDKAMAEFGVTSVTQLQPDQYQPLLNAVRAIAK